MVNPELTVTCGRCGYSDERRKVEGILQDLPGAWAALALLVRPVAHMLLCPTCAAAVKAFLVHPDFVAMPAHERDRLVAIADAAQAAEIEMVRSGADSA